MLTYLSSKSQIIPLTMASCSSVKLLHSKSYAGVCAYTHMHTHTTTTFYKVLPFHSNSAVTESLGHSGYSSKYKIFSPVKSAEWADVEARERDEEISCDDWKKHHLHLLFFPPAHKAIQNSLCWDQPGHLMLKWSKHIRRHWISSLEKKKQTFMEVKRNMNT